jgi:dipeptidyl aminopeptidase/acylaminoacyl peptidase
LARSSIWLLLPLLTACAQDAVVYSGGSSFVQTGSAIGLTALMVLLADVGRRLFGALPIARCAQAPERPAAARARMGRVGSTVPESQFDCFFDESAAGAPTSSVAFPDRVESSERSVLSPDGRRRAMVVPDGNATCKLVMSNADGSDVIEIRHGGNDFAQIVDLRWSPDSMRVALRGRPAAEDQTEGAMGLFVVELTGGEASCVHGSQTDGAAEGQYAWSPDGTRLAFHLSFSGAAPRRELCIHNVKSKQSFTSVSDSELSHIDFAWSPDGRKMAVVLRRACVHSGPGAGTVDELHLASATGDRLTVPVEPLVRAKEIASTIWSADGRRLAFTSRPAEKACGELRVIRASDSLLATVLHCC